MWLYEYLEAPPLASPAQSLNQRVENVLEIEEIPNVLVKQLDGTHGIRFQPTEAKEQSCGQRYVATDHWNSTEHTLWSQNTGRDSMHIVEKQAECSALCNAGYANLCSKRFDFVGLKIENIKDT
jgi:hypothetical protein